MSIIDLQTDKMRRIEQWVTKTNEVSHFDRGFPFSPDSSSSGTHHSSLASTKDVSFLNPHRDVILSPLLVQDAMCSKEGAHVSKRPSMTQRKSSLPIETFDDHLLNELEESTIQSSSVTTTESSSTKTQNHNIETTDRVPRPILKHSHSTLNSVLLHKNKLQGGFKKLSCQLNEINPEKPGSNVKSDDKNMICFVKRSLSRSEEELSSKVSEMSSVSSPIKDPPLGFDFPQPFPSPSKEKIHTGLPEKDSLECSSLNSKTITSSIDYVTEADLLTLALLIGNKLPFLTVELGLELSQWDYALKNYKLPDTQALYILHRWYGERERTVGELCQALCASGLEDIAARLQKGCLKQHVIEMQDRRKIQTRHHPLLKSSSVLGSFTNHESKPTVDQRGFSLHGEDGRTKVILSQRSRTVTLLPDVSTEVLHPSSSLYNTTRVD